MSEFKVGDRVYCPIYSEKIFDIANGEFGFLMIKKIGLYFNKHGVIMRSSHACVFHATQENHDLLSKLYPNVKFEKPKLTGSDLTRQLLAEGAKEVLCWVGEASDQEVINDAVVDVVKAFREFGFICSDASVVTYAVPVPRNHYAMDDSDE